MGEDTAGQIAGQMEWGWTDETRVNYLAWNVSRGDEGGTKAVMLGAEGTGWHDDGAGWTTLPGVCLKTRGPSEPTPLFVVGAGTWDEVRARCRMGGGDLASLHTPTQAALAGAVCGEPRCYIGLQRATPAAAWGWVDDSEANYLPWDRAEPARNGTKAVFVGAHGLSPSPYTLQPTPYTLYPTHETLNPQHFTLNPNHSTPNPKP